MEEKYRQHPAFYIGWALGIEQAQEAWERWCSRHLFFWYSEVPDFVQFILYHANCEANPYEIILPDETSNLYARANVHREVVLPSLLDIAIAGLFHGRVKFALVLRTYYRRRQLRQESISCLNPYELSCLQIKRAMHLAGLSYDALKQDQYLPNDEELLNELLETV